MDAEPLDRKALARLLELIGGDVDDMQELVDEFEESTPGMVDTMRRAASEDDVAALRITAHSLKSNARDLGASALADQCEALEHAARDGAVDDAADRIDAIEAELGRARAALAQMNFTDG